MKRTGYVPIFRLDALFDQSRTDTNRPRVRLHLLWMHIAQTWRAVVWTSTTNPSQPPAAQAVRATFPSLSSPAAIRRSVRS